MLVELVAVAAALTEEVDEIAGGAAQAAAGGERISRTATVVAMNRSDSPTIIQPVHSPRSQAGKTHGMTSRNDTANPMIHHFGGRRCRTIELILSVTEPNVWPGAITAGVPEPTTA